MKPKLLVFCYEFAPVGGGAGNALAHLTAHWKVACEVTVITSRFGNLPVEEIRDGVRIIRLDVGRKELARGRVTEMIRYGVQSLFAARRLAHKERPDLCVAFMALPSGVAPLFLCLRHGIPFVTELRGGDVPGFDPAHLRTYHWLTRPLIHLIWRKSRALVANSSGLKSLAQKSAPPHPVEVIPNGVDADRFCPSLVGGEGNPSPTLLFVGRLVESQKNIGLWIQALAQMPSARLMLVGDGPDRELLRGVAGRLGVTDRVEFRGWLKGKDLERAYQNATLYVTASLWEGMPNSVLEAMASGLPVVATRIAGHDELVREGETGFLFDPKQPQEGMRAATQIIHDFELARRMGDQGRKRILGRFEWHSVALRHLEAWGLRVSLPAGDKPN